ncbi:hypothetical protein ACJMK2_016559 [Sinanodonta woodiana]|uniref:Cysteine and tyrosine-rich protein 1 n=1 Tax=Sinanodonta woodiana TaxID=1069815 RepID=A0ABD3UTZ5_SINWO
MILRDPISITLRRTSYLLIRYVKSSTTCYNNGYRYTKYCQYGCCGSSGYQYCCDDYSPIYPVGAIVGIVIGSLAGLGILIGIIVCCCCCCRQSGTATSGIVLQPVTNPAFSMSSVTTTNGTTMQMTQLTPGINAQHYPTFPQMAGGYLPGNAAMNYPYGAPQYMNNPSAAPPPDYDNIVKK